MSRYSHKVAADTPTPKRKASVRILTRRTSKAMAKIDTEIRTIQSHRVLKSKSALSFRELSVVSLDYLG